MPKHLAIRISRGLASLCGARDGAAALEFGLVAPILVAIMVPVIDFGLGFYQQMQVVDAAQAGAHYAMVHGYDSPSIGSAVGAATPLAGITATPSPTRSCGCPNGTGVDPAACGSTCDNGRPAGTYVTVSAQAVYTTLIPYPGIGSSFTLTAQSTARIQ